MRKRIVALAVLLFCTLASQNALAQANLGLEGVGLKLGLVDVENMDATYGLEGFADLGTMAPNLALSSHLGYWGKKEDVPGGGDVSISDVSLSFRGTYYFPVQSTSVHPYAGGGLGLHLLHGEFNMPAQDLGGGFIIPAISESSSDTKLGLELGGGIRAPMNPKTSFVAELWWGVVEDASHMSAKVGLAWDLSQVAPKAHRAPAPAPKRGVKR